MNVMEDLLQRLIPLVENGNDPVELLTELVEHIRPRRAHDGEAARQANLGKLTFATRAPAR